MPEPLPIVGMRIVAAPAALDAARFTDGAHVLRLAPDEVFAIGADEVAIGDPDAIVVRDGGVVGFWLDDPEEALAGLVEWELPRERPALATGNVGGIGARIVFEVDRALVLVPATLGHELAARLR